GRAEAAAAVARPGVEAIGYAVPGATVDFVADVDQLSADALAAALEGAGLTGRRIGVERAQVSLAHHDVIRRLARAGDPPAGRAPRAWSGLGRLVGSSAATS